MIWKANLLWAAFGLTLGIMALPGPARAADCNPVRHDNNRYTVCRVDMDLSPVRLFLNDAAGQPYGTFQALPPAVAIAMNGGMYHDDRSPVGHYLEDGVQTRALITQPGPGNFGLLPNGVLCLGDKTARVIETLRYRDEAPDCTYASQSGPMLVIDGALHPRFLIDATSRKRRNGVGTSQDGKTLFMVITENPVTFHEFGRLFKDMLKVPQALFLDGSISRLYVRDTGRADFGPSMGPILAVLDPA